MRGANFNTGEEMQLCRSYLVIGKDAVTGTGQKSGTFWERIEKHYNENTSGAQRSLRSLETKWRTVGAECSKFVAAMATARAIPRSGENDDDEIERALKVYSTLNDDSDKENEPSNSNKKKSKAAFKLLHCWRILEKEPKWQTFRDPKPADDDGVSASVVAPTASGMERPTGNKAAKADAKSTAAMETTYKRIASATVQTARASAKRVKLMEEANNMALFTIPLANLDATAQRYFTMRRSMVLHQMENDAAAQALEDANGNDEVRAPEPTQVDEEENEGGDD